MKDEAKLATPAEPESISETPILDAAVLAAQRDLKLVSKDGRNTAMGFDYTRGDTLIDAARTALHLHGCIPRRREFRLDTFGGENGDMMIWISFEILHVPSGQRLSEWVPWFAIPGKGRPSDKAVAGALTSAFSYWLVGQLAIPRHEKGAAEDMSERDDTNRPRPPTPQQWLNIAAKWKSQAVKVMKSDNPAESKVDALLELELEAASNPLGPDSGGSFPPKIWAKLRGYFKQFRKTIEDEPPPEGPPPDEPSGAGDSGPPADAVESDPEPQPEAPPDEVQPQEQQSLLGDMREPGED